MVTEIRNIEAKRELLARGIISGELDFTQTNTFLSTMGLAALTLESVVNYDHIWLEEQTARKLIEILFNEAEVIVLDDGEGTEGFIKSQTEELLDKATDLDECSLSMTDTTSGKMVWFYLAFGNGAEDLVADCTDTPYTEGVCKMVSWFAEMKTEQSKYQNA